MTRPPIIGICPMCFTAIEEFPADSCPHCNAKFYGPKPAKNYIAILVGPTSQATRAPEFFSAEKLAKAHCDFYNHMKISFDFGGNEQAWKDDENSVSWEYWSRDQYEKTFGPDECAKAFGV